MEKIIKGLGIKEHVEKFRREKKKKVNTKTKMLVLLEIAIVLCSVLLVALPAISADQNQGMEK